jgi:hypothetical protein
MRKILPIIMGYLLIFGGGLCLFDRDWPHSMILFALSFIIFLISYKPEAPMSKAPYQTNNRDVEEVI